MAIDIKNLIEFAQGDINSIDSTGDTQRILELAKFARRQAQTTLHMYDSTSDLPNLLDDVADTAQLVYVKNRREVYFNDGSWKPMTQTAPVLPPSYSFQGSNFGYASGGSNPAPTALNTIDKFPFASDASASDVGDLFLAARWVSGQSSSISGYTAGGITPSTTPVFSNVIQKFSFSSDGNGTEVGDLTVARYGPAGQSSSDNGYASGGNPLSNVIDKFPFSSDANASDVGDLTQLREGNAGQSSAENGYTSGGVTPPATYWNIIDKFPFATDANATDVGDLTVARRSPAGQSSTDNGYTSGGGVPVVNVIDKFPFSSDANASDVGDLTVARREVAGQSSTISGYTSGGYNPVRNEIDKFPFASDANATDVGDLTAARANPAGQQY